MLAHVALWVSDLERMKNFYVTYFGGVSGALYYNKKTAFRSYFLSFEGGARLELMHSPAVPENRGADGAEPGGWAHIAFAAGGDAAVDALTRRLTGDGYRLLSGPRTTGDGYYESCILDPEGNRVEIVA